MSGYYLTIITAFLVTAVQALPDRETRRQLLSGPDAEHTVPWEFRCSGGRNSGAWSEIGVPSCWELQGFGSFRYGHGDKHHEPIRGDYRHRFNVPADWQGRRVFIVFDGVMTDAAVEINGVEAGPTHQGAFYQFKHDITKLVRFGGENLLEVGVLDQSADASVNRAEREADYWIFGGIFRPVWLQAEPPRFIDRVAIDAKADGTFTLDYFLGGEGDADAVSVTLLDASGKSLGEPATVSLTAGRVAMKVPNPALWSAENPVLHTAVVQLRKGGTVLHEIRQRFGFRTIEARAGDGFYVNGRRVMMRGVCHHVAWPTLGRASSPRIAKLDLDLIQEMNMNAVRMSHYPPDEGFLAMCDERGIYVIDELAGWQAFYDTGVGAKRVGEMLARDVNHPCVVLWSNGNEGGFNFELDDLYARLDPQRRPVIHPWARFREFETKHYPDYHKLTEMLVGDAIVMPTEFLHGLYDGGHGAGLEDYWNAMRNAKNSAGGFLWVFADEGVQRSDMDNTIDVAGNAAPDGIVGPFRKKEGSFHAIRQIWSPVQLPPVLPANFDGSLAVENRYELSSLSRCRFRWELRRFPTPDGAAEAAALGEGSQPGPEIAAGKNGALRLALPANWRVKNADALAVTATDWTGRDLWTWVYPLRPRSASVPTGKPLDPRPAVGGSVLKSGGSELRIDSGTGNLLGVTIGGREFSLRGVSIPNASWQALDSGWFRLRYSVDPAMRPDPVGVAFDYPEEKMLKKTWLGDGPYRVWRNRLKGVSLGEWETVAGDAAVYPEFEGFFSGVRWLRLTTTEGAVTLVIPDEDKFVRVGTPKSHGPQLMAKMDTTYPQGNLAVLADIPAIGNKFHTASQTGPQAATPLATKPFQGTIFLRFDAKGR
ncbi:MAG: glycoside hydrolase family 2 [Verrucomicrobia bacterium]|nr:glycoside hydrolase family 2 [Verrucomicrobiota bacterium]